MLVVCQVVGNLDLLQGLFLQVVAVDSFKFSTEEQVMVVKINVSDLVEWKSPCLTINCFSLSVLCVENNQLIVIVGQVECLTLGM